LNRTTTITTTATTAATETTPAIPVSIIRFVQFQVKLHALLKTEEGIYIGIQCRFVVCPCHRIKRERMIERERERERERDCVWMCVWEEWSREWERVCGCACGCVCERWIEWVTGFKSHIWFISTKSEIRESFISTSKKTDPGNNMATKKSCSIFKFRIGGRYFSLIQILILVSLVISCRYVPLFCTADTEISKKSFFYHQNSILYQLNQCKSANFQNNK